MWQESCSPGTEWVQENSRKVQVEHLLGQVRKKHSWHCSCKNSNPRPSLSITVFCLAVLNEI